MPFVSRRALSSGLLAGSVLWGLRAAASEPAEELLSGLEQRHGGRLGVAILDTGSGKAIAHRGDERFPLCSTHKLLAAAFVLARVDREMESLGRRVVYARGDLVPYSPVTEDHADGSGMTVGELCEAALTVSDNTAANLLLDSFGGPAALTAYLRSLGDGTTRLDRREPELNEAKAGDPRDTTTPAAMLATLRRIVLGEALSIPSRDQLTAWLVACKTGSTSLRAGVPGGWRIGDKTGSGENNATNDVAVIWPPGHAPLVVTAYSIGARASREQRLAVLADVGRLAATV